MNGSDVDRYRPIIPPIIQFRVLVCFHLQQLPVFGFVVAGGGSTVLPAVQDTVARETVAWAGCRCARFAAITAAVVAVVTAVAVVNVVDVVDVVYVVDVVAVIAVAVADEFAALTPGATLNPVLGHVRCCRPALHRLFPLHHSTLDIQGCLPRFYFSSSDPR